MISYISGDGIKKEYVKLGEISKPAKLALIAGEDPNFLKHHGFDYNSIGWALYNWNEGKRLKGASTLTQQTVKNVFLWQGGGWLRKSMEAYLALMAEAIWGKKRILEIYFNVAEMGDGVFGIEAASKSYFNKSAVNLTCEEAVAIVASLPNPKKHSPNESSYFINSRSRIILERMEAVGNSKDFLDFISTDKGAV